ncbi:cytochrome P450 10-like [Lineus longissimus]|uniref:cytochrome P450 10-like n=1 Tax=Lineus longissimus TaxID=88925 RepID=UPI002B4DDA20
MKRFLHTLSNAVGKAFSKIPGPRSVPLLGTVLEYTVFGKHSFERFYKAKVENYKKYGNIYREKIGPFTLVQLYEPHDISKVFRAEGRTPERPAVPITIVANKRDEIPLGLGSLNGEEWYKFRMSLQKHMMHPRAAFAYLPQQNEVADDFANLLAQLRDDEGTVRDLYCPIQRYAIETNSVICFNARLGCLEKAIVPGSDADIISKATSKVFLAIQKTAFGFPWYFFYRTKQYKEFVNGRKDSARISSVYVRKAWESLQSSDRTTDRENGPNLLCSLMGSEKLSEAQVHGILSDLFTAGFDSVSGALSFLLYNMARHPEKQQRLYEELITVIPSDGTITEQTLAKMHYLKSCLKESFRLNFPIEGGTTRILNCPMTLAGYNVPKGTIIATNNQTICRDDMYFDQPDEFIPERWLKDGSATLRPPPRFAMLPFGYGPRMCIGRRFAEQAIYLALIKITKKFTLDYNGEPVGMLNRVFTLPDRPVDIIFKDR